MQFWLFLFAQTGKYLTISPSRLRYTRSARSATLFSISLILSCICPSFCGNTVCSWRSWTTYSISSCIFIFFFIFRVFTIRESILYFRVSMNLFWSWLPASFACWLSDVISEIPIFANFFWSSSLSWPADGSREMYFRFSELKSSLTWYFWGTEPLHSFKIPAFTRESIWGFRSFELIAVHFAKSETDFLLSLEWKFNKIKP